ncbi:3-ketoacyl-CoA synthase 1-like [Punica granatum]|uniref:3-ketoacyl-CoA synthase n=2 Tax=Punica granatum TaxID=22663 RepID=A0A218XJA5_PUNGR|nr:3-ketoacyl-CoA synthase 1-like [Punica granatum]OWM85027.1 hypothetical protein CDL15_Pgr027814 [Punica granatum]PKI58062.1 hypothetical protein CRG98_021555 [Punica granatum]
MKPLKRIIQILQATVAAFLTAALLLHTLLSAPATSRLIHLLTASPSLSLSFAMVTLPLLYLLLRRHCSHPRIYLLDYSCFKPIPDRKCTLEASERFVRRSGLFSPESVAFMQRIFSKSGLGEETYGPPFVFDPDSCGDHRARFDSAVEEAREGIIGAVDPLLLKTGISPNQIDLVVVTCGGFSPSPSLSSFVVNRYKMRDDVKTYNLSGMGCSSGVISIDLAAHLLRNQQRKPQYALVVIIESISLNWYFGDNRSMLVTNCIFRVGCAAALITNDPRCHRSAKMELIHSLRTNDGSDDRAYRAAIQEEDEKGNTGIALTKDLIPVAGWNLRQHIKILGPRVLPLRQVFLYAYSVLSSWALGSKPIVPDFTTAFEHFCVHTGGKAVIEQVGRVLGLSEPVTEPARMTLHRFGNTSSSLVFYELAYMEAKQRVRRGDRLWMIAFGTGFKVGSLVWKSLKDSCLEDDNPWSDCIDRYPVPR